MAVVSAVVGIISALYGGYTQRRAGQQAKRRSKEAAKMEQKTTDEKARRMREDQKRRFSLARSQAGASGVSGASTEVYIDALEKSGRQELDWLKAVGASNYDKHIDEGRVAYDQAMTSAWGSVGNAVSKTGDLWNSVSNKAATTQ